MRCAKLSLFLCPDGSAVGGGRGQRKIPVDLHFIVRLRHKASGAALGLSCAVCFEQPAGVFAGCGAVCQAQIGSGGKPCVLCINFVRKNRMSADLHFISP